MATEVPDSVRRRFFARVDAQKTGEIWIYDDIGSSDLARLLGCSDGISAKDIATAVERCKAEGATALSIFLNSAGGDVFEGTSIGSILGRFAGPKTVYVDGIAASIASVIAMAGDKICMSAGSMMMIHRPGSGQRGTASDMRSAADRLDKIGDAMTEAYAQRTKLDPKVIGALMDAETWMTAKESVEKGFADEVVQPIRSTETAPAEMRVAASALSPILASYKNLPPDLKHKLYAQHPHLSQSPQSRAPDRVPPKPPRASGTTPKGNTMPDDVTEAQDRAQKALALAHKTETDSINTRLNVMTSERDALTGQVSTARAEIATATTAIKSHETALAAFRADAQEIYALTGKTSLAEARGVIAAYKQEASEAKELRAQAEASKTQVAKDKFLALIDKGVNEKKITPAEAEKLKATEPSQIPTATAFIETYFLARAPMVKTNETQQPDPALAEALAGVPADAIEIARAAGMDPAKIQANIKKGDVPTVS